MSPSSDGLVRVVITLTMTEVAILKRMAALRRAEIRELNRWAASKGKPLLPAGRCGWRDALDTAVLEGIGAAEGRISDAEQFAAEERSTAHADPE